MTKLTRYELLKLYDCVGDFHEGLAWAQKNGEEFHIREDGTPLYQNKYDWVGSFKNGAAYVICLREGVFQIDCHGRKIVRQN